MIHTYRKAYGKSVQFWIKNLSVIATNTYYDNMTHISSLVELVLYYSYIREENLTRSSLLY